MKREIYNTIIESINGEEFDIQNTLEKLKEKFPSERVETLRSILTQHYTNEVKKTYRKPLTYQDQKKKDYCSLFQKHLIANESSKGVKYESAIAEIAINNRFSPALLAKIILSDQLNINRSDNDSKKKVKQLLDNTNLIPNGKLAFEVWRACLEDENYGHYSECIKNAVGNEYEKRLKYRLRQLGISFQDEHDLRSLGYDKTPDVVLDIPFSTKDGSIINWIESKALFGSDDNHNNYLKDQLRSYRNRFSTGMVIYWFGFISDLEISSSKEGIFVKDDFPGDKDIILMNNSDNLLNETQSDESKGFLHERPLEHNHYSIDNETLNSEIIRVTDIIENTKIN